jgi:hypothetical protein
MVISSKRTYRDLLHTYSPRIGHCPLGSLPVGQPLPARSLSRHKPAPSNHIENVATSSDGSPCR